MANTLKIKRGLAAGIPQGQLAEPLFTTDTYDLYIGKGSGGNQRFQKYIASGTSSQFLKGDGSLDSTSYQTALTFSSPLVNTSGTISIPAATGSVDGYLSSTDWTTFNSKEPAITAGTSTQYYRGDKTFQTLNTAAVPESGAVYFTEPRVLATVLTGLNLTGGGTIAATDSVLQAFGKVQNQISALVGGATYQGVWNASTNTPTLASGTGTKGYYYVVSVAGSTNLDGITDWKIGDWAIFNGTTWDKVDNTDAVSSVNGFTGAVNLALDNISDVSAASPTNAQLLRFNGTSSLWENWTPTFEPALTKGNLSSGDTSYLTVTGGTGAVIGSGTTVSVYAAGVINGGLTLTTTGNSGAATKSFATLNIPEYTLAGLGGVPTTRTLTINGTAYDLSADRSWSVGTVTGTGTTGTIPKWSSSSALNDSVITQSGSDILIGGTADQGKLQVDGQTAGGLLVTTTDSQFGIAIKNTSSSNKKWDFSPNGNNLQFNESGVEPVLILKGGGGNNVRLYKYTSNGFLKTSGSDGTLTVDTTSYLPLGGGTLTGALSGTSATFSSAIQSGDDITISKTSANLRLFINNTTATTGKSWYFNSFSNGNLYIGNTTASDIFNFSSTGAATFSSSVTATQFISTVSSGTNIELNKGTGPSIAFNKTNATAQSWLLSADPNINFYNATSATTPFVITTGGNVGIGTSSPITTLQVTNTSSYSAPATTGNATGHFTVGKLTDSGLAIGSFRGAGTSGYTWFQAQILDAAQYTNNIVLQPNGGNVGIGVTPSAWNLSGLVPLQIKNASFIGYLNNAYVGANTYYDGGWKYIASDKAALYLQSGTTSEHIWYQAGSGSAAGAITWTQAMTLTSAGELWIGYTTDQGAYALQVNGSVYASAYYESSDIRLKNILSTKASDNFSAIEFNWKDGRDSKKHWGYAAQEVMKFIPNAIEVNKDGMMTVNYNEAHTWKIAMLEQEIKELKAKLN
jgi:hypothetical protein